MKKAKVKEKSPDLSSLLVFGYACKLFRYAGEIKFKSEDLHLAK